MGIVHVQVIDDDLVKTTTTMNIALYFLDSPIHIISAVYLVDLYENNYDNYIKISQHSLKFCWNSKYPSKHIMYEEGRIYG